MAKIKPRPPRVALVSAKGQVVLPKEARRELGIKAGSVLAVSTVNKKALLLKKIEVTPKAEELWLAEKATEALEAYERGEYREVPLDKYLASLKARARRLRRR